MSVASHPEIHVRNEVRQLLFNGRLVEAYQTFRNFSSLYTQLNHLRDLIQNTYRVKVSFDLKSVDVNLGITGQSLPLIGRVRTLGWVKDEIAKYPPEMIQTSLSRMTFLQRCFLSGNRILGLANPDPKYLYVSYPDLTKFEQIFGKFDLTSTADTLHHELLHMFETGDYVPRRDRLWVKINPHKEKAYTKKYKFYQNGFIHQLGREDPEEDRATFAGGLMTNPSFVFWLAGQDKIIWDKVAYLLQLYEKWSQGELDSNFFEDLKAGRVSNSYWDQKSRKSKQEKARIAAKYKLI